MKTFTAAAAGFALGIGIAAFAAGIGTATHAWLTLGACVVLVGIAAARRKRVR